MTLKKLLLAGAILGTALTAGAVPVLVQNGDFEIPDGEPWDFAGEPATIFDFPNSGGNPGGFAIMDNSGGEGFGVLIANGLEDPDLPLDSLGLVAGESYEFFQDMIILSGDEIGRFRVEYFIDGSPAGDSGILSEPLIGDGSTWETYTFVVTLPPGINQIRVVPLWGVGSEVGYDNIGVNNTPVDGPAFEPIPNPGFEPRDNIGWTPSDSNFVTFPETGGNPGGFAQIDASGGDFAQITSNNNTPLLINTLGLTAGETFTFQVDMRIISGSNIGGFTVEFIPTGTGVLTPQLIGDGSTWETYSFDITIPGATTQIFIILVAGPDSVVGYDNVRIDLPTEEPFMADIEGGTLLSWTPTSPDNSYQPQESANGEDFINLGPEVIGESQSSIFDGTESAFYRVLENIRVPFDNIFNGGFEIAGDDDDLCPFRWVCVGQFPERITTDVRTDDASVRIAIQNDGAVGNISEIQQNTQVFPGESLDFSFFAKRVSSTGTFFASYRIQWLGETGFISDAVPSTAIDGPIGEFVEFSASGIIVPENATNALIQIGAVTGAIDGDSGEVIVDDVVFTALENDSTEVIASTTAAAVNISFPTEEGLTYQVQSATALEGFTDFGAAFTGTGSILSISDPIDVPANFYQVVESN